MTPSRTPAGGGRQRTLARDPNPLTRREDPSEHRAVRRRRPGEDLVKLGRSLAGPVGPEPP
jgi:hypothetical protein